ncbi:hypothetical protein H0H93_010174 [Arthromyces matolae]|nr:hypothetical protein H0H93_010174 [Arthromyces matolae]
MVTLPVELIREIILVLSTPGYPLQYGHKNDVQRALLRLVLVNHCVLDIARPILYSSIVISSQQELNSYLSVPPSLRNLTTSLWLRNFSGRFSVAAELVRVLGPKLRRLALDVPGNELDSSATVREAVRCCSHLEDFTRSGYSPMQVSQPCPPWSDWSHLRRLVLDGPLVNDRFIAYVNNLPHLTHLALIEPRWRYSADGTEAAVFSRLLSTGKRLQKILLIYCAPDLPHLNSLKRLRSMLTLTAVRDDLHVCYMVKEEPVTGMASIRGQIGDGSLWGLHLKNLLDLPKEHRVPEREDTARRSQIDY